jgi:hypothetical protein
MWKLEGAFMLRNIKEILIGFSSCHSENLEHSDSPSRSQQEAGRHVLLNF